MSRDRVDHKPKEILTTGEVARICSVAPRTVSKWFDTGQLRGYRIPGSKDRRIPLQQLVRFMKTHGIPMDKLETGRTRLLVVDRDGDLTSLLRKVLIEQHDYDVQVAECVFEAGALTEQFHPNVILVDTDLPGLDGRRVARFLSGRSDLHDTQMIAMSGSMTESDRQTLLQEGFAQTLAKPFTIGQLIETIDDALAVAT